MRIQLNEKGSHFLEITDLHFQTLKEYALLKDLVDSTGYVTEDILLRLKLHTRSLLLNASPVPQDLLDLYAEVICHDKMKAYGLKQLIEAYVTFVENN
jgi:hypothetical protein